MTTYKYHRVEPAYFSYAELKEVTRDDHITVIASIKIPNQPNQCVFIKEFTKMAIVIGNRVFVFTTAVNNPVMQSDLQIIGHSLENNNRSLLSRHYIQLLDAATLCKPETQISNDMHADLLLWEHSTELLLMLNAALQNRCSQNIKIEIGKLHNISAHTVHTYNTVRGIVNGNSVLLCLTINEVCVSSIELFLDDDDTGTVAMNSYTSDACRGKHYNKLLRGIAILFAPFVFPHATTLLSEAENPISAKIMIREFGAHAYDTQMNQVELTEADMQDPDIFEAIVYTTIDLQNQMLTNRAASIVNYLITLVSCDCD